MAVTNGQQGVSGLQIQGGAAIVAPVSAFPNGVPGNALILIPVNKPTEELMGQLEKGPMAITPEQMWKLLGFNGPAVQVADEQGRPIAIGLEDLLSGLEKHWLEQPDDLNRGRIFAQELLKHGRLARAEQVLSKVVAKGGTGEDWLALGISQLSQDKLDKAEGTLKGAQNLMKESPYPALHLAKLYQGKKDDDKEKEFIEKAIAVDPGCVDAWALLYQFVKQRQDEEKAVAELITRGKQAKAPAAFVALQGFYANEDDTRDKAIEYAKAGLDIAPDEPLLLLVLSALHGQKGDLESVIRLLQAHEGKMSRDVRLANNYFEALFQSRQIEKVTKLLNALAGSQTKEVKQFAIERSRLVAQYLQQQQQQLAQGAGGAQGAGPRKA
jgi:tetratricopeptide (TPR) repeat protein